MDQMGEKMEDMLMEQDTGLGDAALEAEYSTENEDEDEKLIIKLKKPYKFEGKEYTEIDLTGLEDLNAADMIAAEKQYDRDNPGISVMPEVKVGYAILFAARATKLPVEFFRQLPTKEAMKVKNRVMGFLFGAD